MQDKQEPHGREPLGFRNIVGYGGNKVTGVSDVSKSKLSGWTASGKYKFPDRIVCECPHCSVVCNFSLSGFQSAVASTIRSACPACAERVVFFFILTENSEGTFYGPTEVYIWPNYKRNFVSTIEESDVPPQLFRAIQAAKQSYISGNFTATAVTGRRALEGVFKFLVAEEFQNKPLHDLIERVKANMDLSAPLSNLSHAIRKGGNLGAHFDFEREPDEDIAKAIIELLDYLISYLYVLPKRIQDLESKLGEK